MIIDTHCHLDFPEFKQDLNQVLSRAKEANVEYIINVASSLEGSKNALKLAAEFPTVFASIGIHPHHANEITEASIKEIESLAKTSKKIVAIGEVGFDLFRTSDFKKSQEDLFVYFIRLAGRLKLPLIIHSRNAGEETLRVIKKELSPDLRGVMHCFSGDIVFMKKALDLGLYISFTCNITFKNARNLREVVRHTPLERLMLETDAPFLAPQVLRGKRNEPAYLVYLVEALSEILNMSKSEIERITTDNAVKLFGLGSTGA